MRVMPVAQREALLTVEREVHQPEHVGRGQERRQHATTHSDWWPSTKVSNRISSFEKNPASGGTPAIASDADQERPVGDRQVLLQAAHVADVLLAVQRVNHRAGAEEQQALKNACV